MSHDPNSSVSRTEAIKRIAAVPAAVLGATAAISAVADAATPGAAQRKQFAYVNKSTKPGQMCSNCSLFIPGKTPTATGGCKIIPGPISPKGWCKAYTKKA